VFPEPLLFWAERLPELDPAAGKIARRFLGAVLTPVILNILLSHP
jgi:hypothetical protein